MGAVIVITLLVAVFTVIGTGVWWLMMNSWVEKDRRSRGRHHGESRASGMRPKNSGNGDEPRIMRLD